MKTPTPDRKATRGTGLPHRGPLVLLATALLVVGAGAAWWGTATARRGDVTVTWDIHPASGGPVACRGTIVRERRHGDSHAIAPVLRLRPGMNCALPIRVVNRGSGTVHLDTVVLPYMGPTAGPEVQVTSLAGLPRAPAQSDRGLHAAFRLDRNLTAGQSYRFTVHFTYRDDGCTGGTLWIEEFPRVEITSLGMSGAAPGPRTIAFSGTDQGGGCPSA